MDKDNRKDRRRPMRYTAWVAVGPKQLHRCVVSDISESGARIVVENSSLIPDCFFLFLSPTGAARRACRVAWRNATQIGVKFEASLAEAEAAAQRSTKAPAEQAESNAAEPA